MHIKESNKVRQVGSILASGDTQLTLADMHSYRKICVRVLSLDAIAMLKHLAPVSGSPNREP